MTEVFNLYFKFLDVFFNLSWIWLPFVLAAIFFKSWMYYIQRFYWRKLDWILLEVKPPKEIEKSPKNMEQIFAGLWGAWGTISTKYEKYIKGVMQEYFSFEIVGLNGEIHFYLRTVKKYRNLVEAQVYSQYPQAEIREVEDYVNKVSADIPNKNWNLWGCRLRLDKDSAYPIRTYPHLIDITKTDQPFFDPLAGLMELMGKLKTGEQIWVQLVFRPTPDDWQREAIKIAAKLLGKKEPAAAEGVIKQDIRTWWEAIYDTFYTFILDKPAPLRASEKATNEPHSLMMFLSPGEKEIISGIEEKASKKGYEAKMQWVYIARQDLFSMGYVSAVMGILNQFANLNMNSLKPDAPTMTKANYAFAKTRKAYKQRVLMKMLRSRVFFEKGFILNIEELATLFHFPTVAVQAPMTPYVELKKGGPPVDLPLE
jgi:hypothetical protein